MYEVTKVVLAWLLKLGGTNRAPTWSSPGRPGSFTNSFEPRSEGNISLTIKEGRMEMGADADELVDSSGELLWRLLGDFEGL